MKNYVQAEIMSPQGNFEALQTESGLSLLFSKSTEGALFVTQEVQGTTKTGWLKHNLSEEIIQRDFSKNQNVKCKSFDVAENVSEGQIGMAMVINNGKEDHLYFSLGNSVSDLSWLSAPVWTACPFNATSQRAARFEVSKVFFCETTEGEIIVVDTVRDPSSNVKLVSRYFIADGKWHTHDLPIDLEVGNYQTKVGRRAGKLIDGMYTMGVLGDSPQLIYRGLYNPFKPDVAPTPVRLSLPGDLQPESIASARKHDKSTDLFSVSADGLFYFSSSDQQDGAVGKKVFSNPLFQGTKHLYAAYTKNDSKVVVWGLNQSNQVFYTSCSTNKITDSSSWSFPVPILDNIDLISPYINRIDDCNTFFGVGETSFFKMSKDSETDIWKKQAITLPAPEVNTPAVQISSYTTRIQLTNDKNEVIPNVELKLSIKGKGHFYINNLYYVLDSSPITIKTDQLGSITIVEPITDLQGSIIAVSESGSKPLEINPMETPFNKITSLDTSDKLRGAVIKNQKNNSSRPLIGSKVPKGALEQIAHANQSLSLAYSGLGATPSNSLLISSEMPIPVEFNILHAIEADLGDLFNWLESGIEHVVHIIKDVGADVWRFVVRIAEKTYYGVLDSVDKIVGAIRWIYNAIKVGIEYLIEFLEFLFEWKDITRTKKVIKNLTKLYFIHEFDQIKVVKKRFDTEIQTLIREVDGWAGMNDWKGVGASSPSNDLGKSYELSAPSSLLSNHFHNNVGAISVKDPQSSNSTGDSSNSLTKVLGEEGKIFDEFINRMKALALDEQHKSLDQKIKGFVAILSDGVLESTENLMDALFDILNELSEEALKVLDTKIYIPVVNDILKFFGVDDLSYLDLLCWVAAVPITLGYKIAHNEAPFADNDSTNLLINANDLESVKKMFSVQLPKEPEVEPLAASDQVGRSLFRVGHAASGLFSLIAVIISSLEAGESESDNKYSKVSAVLGVLNAGTLGVTNFLVPKDPIQDKTFNWVNRMTTASVILSKLVFSGPGQKRFGASGGIMKNLKVDDSRATGAIVNSLLIIPALCCTCWHFYELSKKSAGSTRSQAILEETSNMTSYISRLSYALAVNDEEPESKIISIGAMATADLITSGLQIAEASLE